MSTNRIFKIDLKVCPFRKRQGQFLTIAQKKKSKHRAKLLQSWFALRVEIACMFSDENIFMKEERYNSQNLHVYAAKYADHPREKKTVSRCLFACGVMFWWRHVIIWQKKLIFAEQGVKVTANDYLKPMKTVLQSL